MIYSGFFDEKMSEAVKKEYGELDVIMANNVFAHIVDINSTTRELKTYYRKMEFLFLKFTIWVM